MKQRLIFGLVLLAVLLSCKEEEEPTLPDPTSSATMFNLPEAVFVEQTAAAENTTAQWSVFNEFKSTLASLSQTDLEKMRTQSEKLLRYSDSLKKEVPNRIGTLPIRNRMDVVHARLELLQQSVNSWVVDSVELKDNYEESITAFNILLYQINEKFEKEAIQSQEARNFSQEVEQRFRDSIFKVEKARQKN